MPHDPNQDLTELHRWIAEVSPEFGSTPTEVPVAGVFTLATAVAQGVMRPGVPVTGFMVGLAVGRGMPVAEALAVAGRHAREFK